jgi:hypothetical protein
MNRGSFCQKKKSTKYFLQALVQLGRLTVSGFQFSGKSFGDGEGVTGSLPLPQD